MPFSLIAIVLVLLSSLSAALVMDVREASDGVELTTEELERMDDLSQTARRDVENIAFQAVIGACSGDTSNETKLSSTFDKLLSSSISSSYPKMGGGHRTDVNVTGVRLSFLRLSLSDGGEGWEGTYIPAYIGICGRFQVRVGSEDGNLTRNYTVTTDTKVPWPLLNDRMSSFSSSVSDGMGELSSMTTAMLDALSAFRAVQGWGSSMAGPDEGKDDMITERDVVNALDLGLIILQFKTFRNATPCYDLITDHVEGQDAWELVAGLIDGGGSIDPADIFLQLYGCERLDWNSVFSQALYASMERLTLRWMEHTHLMDLVNIIEKVQDMIFTSTNDLIDWITGTDLMEDQYKDWMTDRFETAGVPDTLYRYFGAGGPESTMTTPSATMELVTGDGSTVMLQTVGEVSLDLPTIDILGWDGWGDFKDQYELGTKEILQNMRSSLAAMADSISREMFVPSTELVLDPRDGVPFIQEVRSSLASALADKETWLRQAVTAGERYASAADPLAEATYAMVEEDLDSMLGRSAILDGLVGSAAEQILTNLQKSNLGVDLPWEENIVLVEQAIEKDADWRMMDEIIDLYELAADQMKEGFRMGMEYRPVVSGHPSSFITNIIANTGDPLIGLSSAVSDDVDSLLEEMTDCMAMRGDHLQVQVPKGDRFVLKGTDGSVYTERLEVDVVYPSSKSSSQGLHIFLTDPSRYKMGSDDCPQLHDTDLIDMKWASYQSVWGMVFSGTVHATIAPAGEVGDMLPMVAEERIAISSSRSIAVLTGDPLVGVDYRNINTLYENMAKVMDEIFSPLRKGLEIVSSGLQEAYRMLADTVKRLIDLGTKALGAFAELLQRTVERIQDFISDSVAGLKAKVIEMIANVLGEKTYSLNLFGLDLVIKLNPKDLALKSSGVPVSFSLSLLAGDCTISATSRLIKGDDDYSILTNATLSGDDWAVYMVIDPSMDIFSHMVEVRGTMDGACIELVMPEVVTYQEFTLALSDIPGMGALLSNIPTPIPGLKGSVDAGITIKALTGRTDNVVINEYELNPAGEDRGKEWVELYNPTDEAVDLAGWSLQTSHGLRSLSSLGSSVMMPKGRLVYYFTDQALDNTGSGFPFEESIVLLDNNGRHVDSTPFSTDCWNDKRTWQRAHDGTDRWEFKDATRGSRNGMDVFSLVHLTAVQDAYLSAVTESLNQVMSSNMTLESMAGVLSSALLHLGERLTTTILGLDVEMALFVQVAFSDYTSSAKVGMKTTLSLHCGTVGEVLRYLAGSVAELLSCFGEPFEMVTDAPSVSEDVWIGVHNLASMGLPKMLSIGANGPKVQYVTSIQANIATLTSALGEKGEDWGIECGVCIKGIPSGALRIKGLAADSLVCIWLCKASVRASGA